MNSSFVVTFCKNENVFGWVITVLAAGVLRFDIFLDLKSKQNFTREHPKEYNN